MTLVNKGTILANGDHALVIDTGSNVVTNSGTLEATGSGGLIIESGVANSGNLWADGGNITIHGDVTGAGDATISGMATLEFGAASAENTTFADGGDGTLRLTIHRASPAPSPGSTTAIRSISGMSCSAAVRVRCSAM